MLITLSIHNRISNYIASFSAVLLESIYLFHRSLKSPETATAVLLLEIARKGKGGNPVLFDLE